MRLSLLLLGYRPNPGTYLAKYHSKSWQIEVSTHSLTADLSYAREGSKKTADSVPVLKHEWCLQVLLLKLKPTPTLDVHTTQMAFTDLLLCPEFGGGFLEVCEIDCIVDENSLCIWGAQVPNCCTSSHWIIITSIKFQLVPSCILI